MRCLLKTVLGTLALDIGLLGVTVFKRLYTQALVAFGTRSGRISTGRAVDGSSTLQ